MDQNQLIVVWGLSTLIGLIILYHIIKSAVKAGTETRTRLMMYDMYTRGIPKEELERVYNCDKNDDFLNLWNNLDVKADQ